MDVGFTHNDLRRSHRQCVQKLCLVQGCDLAPLTNEIDFCTSFHSLVKSAAFVRSLIMSHSVGKLTRSNLTFIDVHLEIKLGEE
jgi:hypothetical protein